MPLVAAAVCPHPPILVPEVAAGAAGELDELRSACDAALDRLVAAGARTIVVIGPGGREESYLPPLRGSFRRWGLPMEVTLGEASPGAAAQPLPLPPSLTVGAWLLRDRCAPGAALRCRMATVAADATPAECAEFGRRLGDDGPWALLTLGDGSACRGEKSPGYDDPRAVPYDDAVAAALGRADLVALGGLDPVLSAELRAGGRGPWQALAAAAEAAGGQWRGELLHYSAPYGVGYFVAVWERP